MEQNLGQNKNNAIAFYKMAYEGNPRKATELYVAMNTFSKIGNSKVGNSGISVCSKLHFFVSKR